MVNEKLATGVFGITRTSTSNCVCHNNPRAGPLSGMRLVSGSSQSLGCVRSPRTTCLVLKKKSKPTPRPQEKRDEPAALR